MITHDHTSYANILLSRGIQTLEKNTPLWKLKLTDVEYNGLKQTLKEHEYNLSCYGMEAALCYAEWWRRDYRGNVPSKEDVATDIGIDANFAEELYKAARNALKKRGYTFFHSTKRTEYFRTLLNQGGLPVNYIKNNEGNMGSFSRFLKGLIRELSEINYDWNNEDNSIIQQFSCIAYLGKAFKNENIYDVAMQIAHAIIMDDNNLLPYDDTDRSFAQLTKSLKNEYSRAKHERRSRPLSLHWKLKTSNDGHGFLFVNLDVVKDISSNSIPGLNISTCSTFDVFVAGTLVGKYVRKSINRNEFGEEIDATYTRISVGLSKDILWKGEPVVEVKVRCDNDDRLFLSIAGCYPPNFDYPQVFQMLDENLYSMRETANAENNIAVFSPDWQTENSKSIIISRTELHCKEFAQSIHLKNIKNDEEVSITNKFTPYTAEFSGNYITWIEDSNYKLLHGVPVIRVYDKEKNKVNGYKAKYRVRNNNNKTWRNLNSSCILPCGLVDILVEFPDEHSIIETFYAINNLHFESCNESAFSTEIVCHCEDSVHPEICQAENLTIQRLSENSWKLQRNENTPVCPSTCSFRIYAENNPVLRISIAIPFDGIMITDVHGNIVPNEKIISLANLGSYNIISHGFRNRFIDVSYSSEYIEDETKLKHLNSRVINGLVSLADYNDLIMRMFNLYGLNSFDRSSSVVLNVAEKRIFIRKFVLDSTIYDGKIMVVDTTEEDTSDFKYDGNLHAFPIGDNISNEDFYPIKLIREDENIFSFPNDFAHQEVVIFSGPEVKRRVIPKYYNRNEFDYSKEERIQRLASVTNQWQESLLNEDIMFGSHWHNVCKAYEICSHYNLPFTTYNGIKSVVRDPKLFAKFVLAMWLNDYRDVLTHDIDRFEQEMAIALHWIPQKIWAECIDELFNQIPNQLQPIILSKMLHLVELLRDLFNSTISNEISDEFANYLISGSLSKGSKITNSDINKYKSKIIGLSDTNRDLPTIKYQLHGVYYPYKESMLSYYRVMIESAMCAAENTGQVADCTNLFSKVGNEHAKVVNFYRKYFKETYSEIFLKTLKLIINPT